MKDRGHIIQILQTVYQKVIKIEIKSDVEVDPPWTCLYLTFPVLGQLYVLFLLVGQGQGKEEDMRIDRLTAYRPQDLLAVNRL